MKKQTAVEWLIKSLSDRMYIHCPEFGHAIIDKIVDEAKAMEKEQMMKTWTKAIDQTQERAWNVIRAYDDFDDYYNETLCRLLSVAALEHKIVKLK
jgi:uncharacterized protein YllA (UPF0747 family)